MINSRICSIQFSFLFLLAYKSRFLCTFAAHSRIPPWWQPPYGNRLRRKERPVLNLKSACITPIGTGQAMRESYIERRLLTLGFGWLKLRTLQRYADNHATINAHGWLLYTPIMLVYTYIWDGPCWLPILYMCIMLMVCAYIIISVGLRCSFWHSG